MRIDISSHGIGLISTALMSMTLPFFCCCCCCCCNVKCTYGSSCKEPGVIYSETLLLKTFGG